MAKPIAGDRIIDPNDQTTINRILQTIRTKEAGNNYTAINKGKGANTNWATGAYQYLNSTWKVWASRYSVASPYPTAAQAPPHIQDFIAEMNVRSILASHSNHLAAVPVVWYYPKAWENDMLLDQVPVPGQGNTMTVRAYAESWIKTFDGTSPTGPNANIPQIVPDANSNQSVWDAILYGVTHPLDAITNPFDAMKALVEMLATAGKFLANPDTWIRLLQVVGGTVLVSMGFWVITHDSGNMIPKASDAIAAAAVL